MNADFLSKEEKVVYELNKLYKNYGYTLFKTGKFEDYSLYLENESFINSQPVITFGDLTGKVKALKPDVTLSIVKNTKANENCNEKFFYNENVYRLDKSAGEYREIQQIGLEFLGKTDVAVLAEICILSMKTLNAVGGDFVLDVSQSGVVKGLTEYYVSDGRLVQKLLNCVRLKNLHDAADIIRKNGVCEKLVTELEMLLNDDGDNGSRLDTAQKLCRNETMSVAVSELKSVLAVIENTEYAGRARVDFSIGNDFNYYNGIILQGYVKGIPKMILSGGRYDSLVKSADKNVNAMGFALYLGELKYLNETAPNKTDALILYGKDSDCAKVILTAEKLRKDGKSVRIDVNIPSDAQFGEIIRM